MKRTMLTMVTGVTAGCLAYFGWVGTFRPAPVDNLATQLEWMHESLQLSPEQFARIKALHEQSSPRLLALAAQVGRMQEEFAAFERERQTVGQVDFLEFARFVERRRNVSRECVNSTRRLIFAASEVMSPTQQERYLTLVDAALHETGAGRIN